MKKLLALFCVFMMLTLTSCNKAQDAEDNADQTDAFTGHCQQALDNTLMQGAVYAAVNGEELLSLANGKADKAAGIDNSADVVYQFASVTKQFTAAAILRLYEDGKLRLDDTLGKYFPDCPYGDRVTVHMLLCMRSGIPDYVNDPAAGKCYGTSDLPCDVSPDKTSKENRNAVVSWLFAQEPLFAPDSQFKYSNSDYLLLGEIIEQVCGMTYHEYLTKQFFEPLGMTTAGFNDAYENRDATLAKAYSRDGETEWTEYPGARFGCGDLVCSPKDMAKWATALMSGRVLSDASWKLMTTNYSPEYGEDGYGYGMIIKKVKDRQVYFHTGRFSSYFSMMVMIPDVGYVGVTASNHSDESAVTLCQKIATLYLEEKVEPSEDLS